MTDLSDNMNLMPTELEMLLQDERLLLEEIEYEEINLQQLKDDLKETREKIATEINNKN